jgi:hypothetical protein
LIQITTITRELMTLDLTKWVVVLIALGFAGLGAFIAVCPTRLAGFYARMPGNQLQYPVVYVRVFGIVAAAFALACAVLAALFGHQA